MDTTNFTVQQDNVNYSGTVTGYRSPYSDVPDVYPVPYYPAPPRDVCPGCGRCRQCGQSAPVPRRTYEITWAVNSNSKETL